VQSAASLWQKAEAVEGASVLSLWHLASLDAPTVAVVWSMAIGWSAHVQVRGASVAVLALGTWIVYVLDRLLDGLGSASGLRARHHFHRRYGGLLLGLCALASMVLAGLCWGALPRGLVGFYLLLGVPVAGYALWVHGGLLRPDRLHHDLLQRGSYSGRPAGKRSRWEAGRCGSGKEVAVAVLFTAAVVAPAFAAAGPGAGLQLLVTSVLVAGLFFLNCAFISYAENPGGSGVGCWLGPGSVLLAVLATAGFAGAGMHGGLEQAPYAAVAGAALLLRGLLSLQRGRADAHRLRILADAALLTPAPFLLVHLVRVWGVKGSWAG
jgi:hypothetical protein